MEREKYQKGRGEGEKEETERQKNNAIVDAFLHVVRLPRRRHRSIWRNENLLDIFSNQQISKIFSSSGKISSHRLYFLLLFVSFI